eukprot:COSAG02_NODE_32807_length_510_cov_0.751825_2_plen_21_part_01
MHEHDAVHGGTWMHQVQRASR